MRYPHKATSESAEIAWEPETRVAVLRFTAGVTLTGKDGVLVADALTRWVGDDARPFGVLADVKDLRAADSEFRARASDFFRKNRSRAAIALINLGPVVAVMGDMFRIGTGVRLTAFSDESAARAWLRQQACEVS